MLNGEYEAFDAQGLVPDDALERADQVRQDRGLWVSPEGFDRGCVAFMRYWRRVAGG